MDNLEICLEDIKIKNNLLSKLRCGETTLDEFNIECAYWGLEYLDKYKYQEFPEPPLPVINYAKQKVKNPYSMETLSLFSSPELTAWYRLLGTWRAENKSNYEWLIFLHQHLKTFDEKYKVKIAINVFNEHKEWRLFGKPFLQFIAANYSLPAKALTEDKKIFEY